MAKKIVLLTGSPRRKGNTAQMADALAAALEEKGCRVVRFDTAFLPLGGCRDCRACYRGEGACAFGSDGFNDIARELETADGLVLAERAGAKLLYQDTLQYHPTGVAFPKQIYGALVTEKVRSMGAKLVNSEGEVYVHPLETRDVNAAALIRECSTNGKGVPTPDGGKAVWLDTPMIDMIHGEGTLEKRLPAMLRMYLKFGIDMRKTPILVYPTLHYQNGGIEITVDGQSGVENLFVAGEAVGGIHGRNRLMGNSLLDIIVFGRNAGQQAAKKAKGVTVGKLSLEHVNKYEAELEALGVKDQAASPKLLPDYTRKF